MADGTPQAERLTKHREGVATRLKRIEIALADHPPPSASATICSRTRTSEVTSLDDHSP